MVDVPMGKGAYERVYAGEPEIQCLNRFFETNPTNQTDGVAMLARPGTTRFGVFGLGPIRGFHAKRGAFNGDLFVVSGGQLYRHSEDGTTTTIVGEILGTGEPSMATVVGVGYQHLFIADGLLLQCYRGGSQAIGTLTLTPAAPPDISTQVVRIGTTYYGWSATVNAGTPDGTVGNPFRALLGATDANSLDNLDALLNFSGIRGTTYSSTVGGPNPLVSSSRPTSTTLRVTARSDSATANSIVTTVTGLHLAWGSGTLTGGGVHALIGVLVPDGLGIVSLATIASHVMAVVANSQKFFFIRPGEIVIDPLDFAEAESEPDNIDRAHTVGDQVWFVGQETTEVWYATGDLDTPFRPIQGRAYPRGVTAGTSVKVKDGVILVGDDGNVYNVTGGVALVSTHGIAERIRTQIRREAGL